MSSAPLPDDCSLRVPRALPRLRALLLASVLSLLAGCSVIDRMAVSIEEHEPYSLSPEARALHESLLVGDLHSDSLLWRRDLRQRVEYGHMDLPRMREGNMALQVMGVVTQVPLNQSYEKSRNVGDLISLLAFAHGWPLRTWTSNLERALYQAAELQGLADEAPEEVRLLRTRDDLHSLLALRAGGSPVVGTLLATEGAHPLESELGNLEVMWEAGFRMLGLLHFFDNELGGSLHGASAGGLTPFGRDVVRKADTGGWILDVAHSSRAVVDETLALATRPLVVSHTGMRGHCPTERNLEDERLKAIAERGGLIGIGFWVGAVCDISPAGVAGALRHAVDVLGVEHVALGSDWDGGTTVRFDASELAALTQALLDGGFDRAEIRAVMGGNLARFLEQALPPALSGS